MASDGTSSGVPGYGARSGWSRDHARRIERTEHNTTSIFYPPATDQAPDVHVWDTWLLRDRNGTVAEIDGYRVAFSLTAPADLLPGKRHDVATIRYFYSADGRTWHSGDVVFENHLGQRTWAGSALLDDGEIYVFYTAAGEEGAEDLTYTQRIVGASGGRPVTDDGFRIEGSWTHHELIRPGGERYEREDQSRGMIYTFRDPWFFEDPETGEAYLLFEANTPVPEGSDACGGDPAQQEFNGSVGLAHSPTGDPLEWELQDPLLDSVCVNQELERPHVVLRDGRYYLFVSSHMHTFAPGIEGYDALYGFVANSLRGEYEPLNGSGLVATNPANAPFQAYSWMAFPHREEVLVQSFFNYYDFDADSLDLVSELSESEQMQRFGGTLGPTVRLQVEGTETKVLGTLDHWEIPLPDEDLPPTDRDIFGRASGRSGDRGSYQDEA
jgi:levansucrase